MKNLTLLLSFFLLATSCGKDKEALPFHIESLNKCIKLSSSKSPEQPTVNHAEFRLKGQKILMNEEEGRYRQISTVAWLFTTDGPDLNPSTDSSRQYLLKLGFQSPAPPRAPGELYSLPVPETDEFFIALQAKENLSVAEFIDNHIQVGDLKLKRKPRWDSMLDPALGEGFEINYWCIYCCKENDPTPGAFAFASSNPDQDGSLTCTKLIRTDLGENIRYQIEFEFACKLFGGGVKTGSDIMESIVVGQIEEGRMAVDFVVEK